MSRINTNVSALIAQHSLANSNADLSTRLQRLSTGLKINRGSDNPSGLIVSERLRSEINGVSQAIDKVERASSVISTAEAALQEINAMLVDMKSSVIEAANTGAFSREEILANQLQIDSVVDSITRIANTASFSGLKLLNGSLDYIHSGVQISQIVDLDLQGVSFGTNDRVDVSVEVLNSAERATVFVSAGGGGILTSSVMFAIGGNVGVEVFEFTSGVANSGVVAAINSRSEATGVSASVVDALGIRLDSVLFGADQFVSVEKLSSENQSFRTVDVPGGIEINRDAGENVLALVNGNLAVGNGLNISLRTSVLNLKMGLTPGAAQRTGTSYEFTILGGGTTYQVGPAVNIQQQIGFGLPSVTAHNLGGSTTGYLIEMKSGGDAALSGGTYPGENAKRASDILSVAIDQIMMLRGRLGAFERNTLQATLRNSQIVLENLTSSESAIRDADFAEETAAMTRAQILQQAGTSTLAIANNTAANALSLLG